MNKLVFEGEEYVSSKRASSITGYAKDYIGQLCRLGKLNARMVGRNWYIALSALEEHKKSYKKEIETLQHKETGSEVKTAEESAVRPATVIPKSEVQIEIFKKERYPRRMIEETVPLRYEADERPLIPHMEPKKETVDAMQVKSQSTSRRSASLVQRAHTENSNSRVPIVGVDEIIPDPFEIAKFEREMAIQQPISHRRESINEVSRHFDITDKEVLDNNQTVPEKLHIARLSFAIVLLFLTALYSSVFVVEQRIYERTAANNDYALVSSGVFSSNYFLNRYK